MDFHTKGVVDDSKKKQHRKLPRDEICESLNCFKELLVYPVKDVLSQLF